MSQTELTPTVIDALQEEATPPEYPKGAPRLWPYLRLPFRKRADFFRTYKAVQEKQNDVQSMTKRKRGRPSESETIDSAQQLYELYAMMDDLLRIAAVDDDEYDRWINNASDEEFMQVFSTYSARSQPGEA